MSVDTMTEKGEMLSVRSGRMVGGRASPAEAFFLSGWRRKMDCLRSHQHVDAVCGVIWGESYRAYHARRKERCAKSIRRLTGRENLRQPTLNITLSHGPAGPLAGATGSVAFQNALENPPAKP